MEYDEAIQLLRKGQYRSQNNDLFNEDMYVKCAIERCKRLPLAISIISGLDLGSNNDLKNIITAIGKKDLLPDCKFNTFVVFDISVGQLQQNDQKLFRSLGVFVAEDIPIESIISLWGLWDISSDDVTGILKRLHQRSLLNFVDTDRLV